VAPLAARERSALVRDRHVKIGGAGAFAAGAGGEGGWLAVTDRDGTTAMLELTEGELLMAIEALAMVYADVVGANPASVAHGLNRTLRNRTRAARERRRGRIQEAA
jgi:hypothetical protein